MTTRQRIWTLGFAGAKTCCILMCALENAAPAQACLTNRVSLDANGQEIAYGYNGGIAAYGRFVTFTTSAALLPADNNAGTNDIYLVDTASGSLELISLTYQGGSGNLPSEMPADLSEDGRMVAFHSRATNMLPGQGTDENAFVRDRVLGLTRMVSVSSTGVEGGSVAQPRISGDGRYVVFVSLGAMLFPGDNNNRNDVFVRDLVAGTTELVSITSTGTVGNNDSGNIAGADISRGGRFVVFPSGATNLISGYVPAFMDIYLRDRLLGVTSVVSRGLNGQLSNGGSSQPVCSEDGQMIAFMSAASNLVSGDTNSKIDIFVRNIGTGMTDRVSVSSTLAQGNDWSTSPSISPDGRFVGFMSMATNLVPGDNNGAWDVFMHDRVTRQLERISVNANGLESNGDSYFLSMSRDAVELVFHSVGSNLVPGDTNLNSDVFHRRCGAPAGYCVAKVNSQGCVPAMSTLGIPMASGTQAFLLEAQQVLNHKAGMLLFSIAGPNAAPFGGGTLCLLQPVKRTPGQNSGGSIAGVDCSGTFSFDFNAWIASGVNPALVAGCTVWAQYWSRDPGFPAPFNSSLTDAQTFVIWP